MPAPRTRRAPRAVRPTGRSRRSAARGRTPASAGSVAGISDEAVHKATGRAWPEWIRVLNAAGARTMEHRAIAELLHERYRVPAWWSQMVTVGYEQAMQGRRKHEKPGGFEISVSKTVNVPLAALYAAWQSAKTRARWLDGADLVVRKATRQKSMRITWDAAKGADATTVSVNFYGRGPGKSSVAVQHGKLRSPAAADRTKRFWSARLEALKDLLES